MPSDHSPDEATERHVAANGVAPIGHSGSPEPVEDGDAPADIPSPPVVIITPAHVLEYWHGYIDERPAAKFIGVEVRTLQRWRQTGEGPVFFRLSSRCVKYTRFKLREHALARARQSTSDMGAEAA